MFKYSFENTGVHPSLATKLSQIVIKRDDLCQDFNNSLNLPQGVSAQASQNETGCDEDRKPAFELSPIKNGYGIDAVENDLPLGDADDPFCIRTNYVVCVAEEVEKLILD